MSVPSYKYGVVYYVLCCARAGVVLSGYLVIFPGRMLVWAVSKLNYYGVRLFNNPNLPYKSALVSHTVFHERTYIWAKPLALFLLLFDFITSFSPSGLVVSWLGLSLARASSTECKIRGTHVC